MTFRSLKKYLLTTFTYPFPFGARFCHRTSSRFEFQASYAAKVGEPKADDVTLLGGCVGT